MSACISSSGEYGDHELGGPERFVCTRCFVFNEDAALEALARAEGRLAAIRDFHAEWGDTDGDSLDQLALWEDLGRLLGTLPAGAS